MGVRGLRNAERARSCSNVAPIELHCTAKTNSIGCAPLIVPVGTPRASGLDSFFVTGLAVIGTKPGLMIWGTSTAAIPFGGGLLCVQPPVVRTAAQNAAGTNGTCDGFFSFHWSQAYMLQKGVQAGDTVHGQYWARDPGFPAPNNVSLSNAATWTIVP